MTVMEDFLMEGGPWGQNYERYYTGIMIKNMAREAVKKATAKNGQLYGSASSLDGIKKIIAQFYYGDPASYSFTATGSDTWSISGPKGIKPGVVVRKSKGRYRFEDE